MAIVKNNDITEGLSGALGDMIVFKQINGRTHLTLKARAPKKQSSLQKANRLKFANASCFAKRAMLDAEKKEYYTHMAKKLKLPNAYTAAITDFMRKGVIKEIDVRKFNDKSRPGVRIVVAKKDFNIPTPAVGFYDRDGKCIENRTAEKKSPGVFYVQPPAGYTLATIRRLSVTVGHTRTDSVSREHWLNDPAG